MTQVLIDRATLEQLVAALNEVDQHVDLKRYDTAPNEVLFDVVMEAMVKGHAALANAEPIGWQAIETAPKDFTTMFDGWNGERVCDVQWARPEYAPKDHYAWCYSEYENGYGWVNHEAKGLTHWMPLPAAPKDTL